MPGIIYARYSSDNQREESIDRQIRECKQFAEKNDIRIIDTYIDRALSAKTDNCPSFQQMIKDSAKGLFDVIIVWKLDRFARNRYDSAIYKSKLKKNGVRVLSAKENISDKRKNQNWNHSLLLKTTRKSVYPKHKFWLSLIMYVKCHLMISISDEQL